jgi:hypothetical protein
LHRDELSDLQGKFKIPGRQALGAEIMIYKTPNNNFMSLR